MKPVPPNNTVGEDHSQMALSFHVPLPEVCPLLALAESSVTVTQQSRLISALLTSSLKRQHCSTHFKDPLLIQILSLLTPVDGYELKCLFIRGHGVHPFSRCW